MPSLGKSLWCTIICTYAIATAALVLEHDLGGGKWTKAGIIDTVCMCSCAQGGSQRVYPQDAEHWALERTSLTAADTARLEQLITSDGYAANQ